MDKLYSIGEVSVLLGITAQTLRFYSNSGLIEPHYVDPKSGYRFFSYKQFQLIDRIKYLQSLGFSLPEIKAAIGAGKVEDLLPSLESHLKSALEQIEANRIVAEKLKWYIDYYRYLGKNHFPGIPYKRLLPERYILAAPSIPGDELFGPGGRRLIALQRETGFAKLEYLRQHGYTLDFDSLMNDKIVPLSYFVYLKTMPEAKHRALQTLPAGEYLCFRGMILTGQWDVTLIRECTGGCPSGTLVVADEYEDNLLDFMSCTYEIQLLL